MSDQYFDYDQMIQKALKGVVVNILEDVSQNGLKGEHHYYVAFRTQDEGVKIPASLKKRYKDEMTIVIQHRYWGLNIQDDYFEIGLSFDNKPELLVIPYEALIGFVDPSAQFALQFDEPQENPSNDTGLDEGEAAQAVIEAGFKNKAPIDKAKKVDNDKTVDEKAPKVVTLDAFRKKK